MDLNENAFGQREGHFLEQKLCERGFSYAYHHVSLSYVAYCMHTVCCIQYAAYALIRARSKAFSHTVCGILRTHHFFNSLNRVNFIESRLA